MTQPESSRSAESLEAEICELWGHLNAGTYRFLELLAEFDRNEGWAGVGIGSCAQWLNWQCGIGAVAAREKVRVARALQQLPQISEAFRLGRISYSKVRAMTRIASVETEDTLLNVALHGTAAQMERLVRKFRWVERIEAAQAAQEEYLSRSVDYCRDEDGAVLIHARLPVEIGAIVEKAIDVAMQYLDGKPGDAVPEAKWPFLVETGSNVSAETPSVPREPVAARRADGLRLIAERFLDTGMPEENDEPVQATSPHYEVVVHIDEKLLSEAQSSPQDFDLIHSADPLRSELDSGAALTLATARRLACDSALVGLVENEQGEPLNIGRRSRAIPVGMKRALRARDSGCRFPGCDRRRFTEGHHIHHWAHGGETSLDNLVTLCHYHHHLVHEGGFEVERESDGVFVFRDADGDTVPAAGRRHIGAAPNQPPGLSWDERGLLALNEGRGLEIDSDTSRSAWLGDKMDCVHVVGLLYAEKYPDGFR